MNEVPEHEVNEEIRDKLLRLKEKKYWQNLPELVSESGYELTEEEKTVVSEWARSNARMLDTLRLFTLKKELDEPSHLTSPNSNGCNTCCNYSGCQVRT